MGNHCYCGSSYHNLHLLRLPATGSKTCRQLAFLKDHQTNLRLTSDLPFHELNELVDGINDILDLSREIKKQRSKAKTV